MKFRRTKQTPEIPRRRPSSDSPAVFSYYTRGSSDNSQNLGRHDRVISDATARRRLVGWRNIPSYIALFMIASAVLYALTLQANPKIVLINQPGTIYRPAADYQRAISDIWRHSVANNTKLTVHSQDIRSETEEQFSELSDVRIELPLLGRRPTVILIPARPAIQFVSVNGVFYVDDQGKVLAKVSDVTQNQLANIPLVRDETGLPAELGKAVVSQPEATFLKRLATQLDAEGLQLESITLPRSAANQADVRLRDQPYYLKFFILSDPRQAVGSYLALKAKLDADHTTPSEYIDLRADEKVFYK
ncbi:MAG TPA: hypothetical protein VM124_03825 [Candidatus Limnocylindrales bacterium]|nr:hypothetical protein [Candidatus Limnocylindrales bacterium]